MLIALLINFFILNTPVQAANYTCVKGKISQTEFGKEKITPLEYCFNKDKTELVSKSCLKKKCQAYKDHRKFDINQFHSAYGKPGFKLCRELKGQPELLEFYVDNKPYKLDRCTFNDEDFVDTGLLLDYYRK